MCAKILCLTNVDDTSDIRSFWKAGVSPGKHSNHDNQGNDGSLGVLHSSTLVNRNTCKSSCTVPINVIWCLVKLECSDFSNYIYQGLNFITISSGVLELLQMDRHGETDRRIYMQLFVTNMHKNVTNWSMYITCTYILWSIFWNCQVTFLTVSKSQIYK